MRSLPLERSQRCAVMVSPESCDDDHCTLGRVYTWSCLLSLSRTYNRVHIPPIRAIDRLLKGRRIDGKEFERG